MNEPANKTIRLVPIATEVGITTPAEERDKAYAIWAWTAGRSFAEVARLTGVHEASLYRWAKQDNWRLRYESDRAILAPDSSRLAIALSLSADAPEAADYLGRVARGEVHADKWRMLASIHILDRAGFAPIHYSELDRRNLQRQAGNNNADRIARLSPDAKVAYVTARRSGDHATANALLDDADS